MVVSYRKSLANFLIYSRTKDVNLQSCLEPGILFTAIILKPFFSEIRDTNFKSGSDWKDLSTTAKDPRARDLNP